ncbi:MAG: AAA family ATPase [Campylobacterales bacterium]|nr:AAA family ATPase [Campylobacterales bacterium]
MSDLGLILDTLEKNNVFLTGGAGVGKSYLTTEVIKYYKEYEEAEVVALGSTGVSAVNIGGFTIHSFFVFGISSNFEELKNSDRRNKRRLSQLKKLLQTIDLIVIDEISMVSSDMLDMISYRLDSMGYEGRLMLVGDFFQLPPIVRQSSPNTLFANRLYAFESDSWVNLNLKVIELSRLYRTSDELFGAILSKIRLGRCDGEVVEYLQNLAQNSSVYANEPTYLFGRNAEVEQMNRMRLDQLPTDETLLFATIKNHANLESKRIDKWATMLPISAQLTLKVDAPVLFTVNKWGRFVNGDRGVVTAIHDDTVMVRKEGEIIAVERHDFELLELDIDDEGEMNTKASATLSQFPLKLAYGVTIHKSQGMSIDQLVCNVDHIFAPSQFYVAISRATNPKHLKIDLTRSNMVSYLQRVIKVDQRVVEYYEALENRRNNGSI